MREFEGSSGRKVKSFYSDNFLSLFRAASSMSWCHPTSTPGVPQSNGLAERMVRRVKEGGRSNLVQSGLPYSWWPYAVRHHFAARNMQVVEGDRPYNRRHQQGHLSDRTFEIPFGALIRFAPTPRGGDVKSAFAEKNGLGLFLGYRFHPGGLFSGKFEVAVWDELKV